MDNGASSYRRFLDGDDNGFVEIIRDNKDGLIFYIYSFVKNISAAEELAEDTFVKLGIKKPHFSGESSFKTWLYAIGRNAALDYIKKKSKCETVDIDELEEIADDELIESSYLREERKIAVHKAMRELKPEYRQVLWLIYFEDFSIKEAAKIMKKSIHNTEMLVWRARQSLRSVLDKEGFTYEDL